MLYREYGSVAFGFCKCLGGLPLGFFVCARGVNAVEVSVAAIMASTSGVGRFSGNLWDDLTVFCGDN